MAPDLLLNDDTSSVFTTSKRKTVGEAGGELANSTGSKNNSGVMYM